ncbi:MAG: FkbM family methyltransferase [Synergistaceae bacterium]|nr:FkbM family methyltransferase [Synergistaceae bacterium]
MKFSSFIPASIKRRIKATKLYDIYVICARGGGGRIAYYQGSYSQKGEDCIILSIFDCLDIEKPSYIDIGANHPYSLSNTALLYERGSRGINIEPNPILSREIEYVRKEDINITAGIGENDSIMPFYVMSNYTLSTFSKQEAEARVNKDCKIKEIINVSVKTLKSIINEYCGGVFPDFMSLDTEGLDEIILRSLKDCPSLPKVICTETWEYGLRENHIPEICAILEPLGYMLLLDNKLNSFFVMRDLWEKAITNRKTRKL